MTVWYMGEIGYVRSGNNVAHTRFFFFRDFLSRGTSGNNTSQGYAFRRMSGTIGRPKRVPVKKKNSKQETKKWWRQRKSSCSPTKHNQRSFLFASKQFVSASPNLYLSGVPFLSFFFLQLWSVFFSAFLVSSKSAFLSRSPCPEVCSQCLVSTHLFVLVECICDSSRHWAA